MGTPNKAKLLSKEELQAAVKELDREIATGTDEYRLNYAVGLAEVAARGIRVAGAFKRWSAANWRFIQAQTRGRVVVGLFAGVRQWEAMDREVKADARYVALWVPTTRIVERDGEEKEALLRFSLGAVVDYSDTVSTCADFVEPSWEVPLAEGDQDTLDALVAVSPVPVRFENLGGAAESGFLSSRGYIVVDNDPSRSVGNMIGTLCHELVHAELGHLARIAGATDPVDERAACEQEAALGEYLLLKMLGLDEAVGNDVTKAAAEYLRSWTDEKGQDLEGHKSRSKLFTRRLDASVVAVEAIVRRYVAHTTACLVPAVAA
jgi:hypothetical protein